MNTLKFVPRNVKEGKLRSFKFEYRAHYNDSAYTLITVDSLTEEDAKQWIMKNKGYEIEGQYFPLHWSEVRRVSNKRIINFPTN